MLRQRVLTSIVSLPLFIAAIWFGNPWFTFWMTAVAILCGIEFYRMASHHKIQPITYLGILVIVLLVVSPHYPDTTIKPFLITLAIIVSLIWLLFRSPKEQAFDNWAWTMAGILYIGWTISYWIDLRSLEAGGKWVFWILFTTIANDTSAYFIGRAWGKYSLATAISPNKTWEGAIGGLLAGVLISLIFSLLFSLPVNYWQAALLGCIISILAQLGDLVESLLKRNAGVKDSGKLFPGHGGILDRMDSFIFTGVAVYYYITIALP